MSCYIVEKDHINAIINVAFNVRYRPFSYYYNKERHEVNETKFDELGQMLLDECVKSVMYRYEDSQLTDLPGRIDAEWLIPFKHHYITQIPKAIAAIKLIDCYSYQSCEHPEWETSEAKAFCDQLKDSLVDMIPGYDEADWDWQEPSNDRVTRLI